MTVVIMAGGRGTRMVEFRSEVPKPMIEICGRPVLQYQITCLREQGYSDIVLMIGHLGDVIENFFGDGSEYGVNITYVKEEEPLGTAGALYFLKDIVTDDFLLINGDIIFDVDIERFRKTHKKNGALATILIHPNNHPYDSGIIITSDDARVSGWLTKEEKREWYKNRVNAGLHMISPELLERFERPEKKDLDRDVLKPLIAEKNLYAYDSPEYIKDMGTPERYGEAVREMRAGLVSKRSLRNRQRAVFLDRDGTINKYAGFLTDINKFELADGVSDAVKLINEQGLLCIVITNQPAIARGELTVSELKEIHNKMETLLGENDAYVDDIFYCPHHPDRGFEGERSEYKMDCECRKPKPGLILQAAKKYNIDLSASWMIGDSESDVQAGINAGCRVAFIGEKKIPEADSYRDLLTCIRMILKR